MRIGNIEVFLPELNCWIPTQLSTLFNHFNSEESEAHLPDFLKLDVKEKIGKSSYLSEIIVSDFYEIQKTILPSHYFFKDKIDILRENEDINKPLNVYCTGKIISKDNKQSFVEYDNFIREVDVVENNRIRSLSRGFQAENLIIKWINITHLLNHVKNTDLQTINYLNKLSVCDILNEVFNQQNNYLGLQAIESIKQDVFLLGKQDNVILAKEVLLLRIFNKITLYEKNNQIIQEKSRLERINNILNCENKRTFKFSKRFSTVIKQILDNQSSKASYFIEENNDNELVTIVLFSENEDDLNNLSKLLDLEEETVEISQSQEDNFVKDNYHILNELKDKSNIIEYTTEKINETLRINVLGEKSSIDNFKQSVKLQIFYFEKYEKMNKESKVVEIGNNNSNTEYYRNKKPRVQNSFNYKNKY